MTDVNDTIRKWHSEGLTDRLIGKKVRMSAEAIRGRRKKMGLPANYGPNWTFVDMLGIPLTVMREDDDQVARRVRLYAGKRYDCFGG